MIKNMGELLRKRAGLTPDKDVFIFPDSGKRVNFAELNERSNRVAHGLLSLGVKKGDRIGILAMNCLEYVELHFASAKLGTIIVPMNWRLMPNELEYIVNNSGMKYLAFDSEQKKSVDALSQMDSTIEKWIQLDGESLFDKTVDYHTLVSEQDASEPNVEAPTVDDDLYIMYTSGTTGRPKGAVHTHASGFGTVTNQSSGTQFDTGDKYITAMPMFHAGGYGPLVVNIYRGVPSIVLKGFDPEQMMSLIEKESATCGMMVPAMVQFIEQVPDFETRINASKMRWFHCGGAPVPTVLAARFKERGIDLLQGYGSTETGGIVCVSAPETCVSRSDSTGKPLLHIDLRIVDEAYEDCDAGEAGELIVRGNCVMRGYWENAEATQNSIKEGWFHTGDVASMDENGFVTIRDRVKDMIISGGENAYPAEIENCILQHPKVLEVGVIGQPSDKWGESPFGVVVKKDESLTSEELLSYCAKSLAGFKRPCGFEFIEALPRNASGKILKPALREKFPGPAPV
jgi:acyl-CoA synthetase (AMP-forming)/AMP-acid ligase II